MDNLYIFFDELTPSSVAVRLAIATFLGGVIGSERTNKRYAAGIRTFALVCLGSALATVVGLYMAEQSGGGADLARIPAQILSGIGFLGAGTIIVTDRRQIKGLTTSAVLWVTASVGIAIGAGIVWPAAISVILVLFTTYCMNYITKYLENRTKTLELYVEIEGDYTLTLMDFIKKEGYDIISMKRSDEVPLIGDASVLHLSLDLGHKQNHRKVVSDIMELKGVHYVEELV